MRHPQKIGRYTIVRPLASGGMAEVYLAQQTGLRGMVKHVAVKRIRPELTERSEIVDVFLEEVRLTADLSHPNVVTLHDAGEDAGAYFLVMEYVEGADLRLLLRRARIEDGGLPLPVVLHVATDAARGLHYAHTRKSPSGENAGLLHRDVSPSNLLTGISGVTKVVDFGIACLLETTGARAQTLHLGKLAYLSPEQGAGEVLTPASDLFSLAAVVWELCTGRALFGRSSRTEIIDAVASCALPPEGATPSLPPALETLLRRCLRRRPEARLESCEAFACALETLGEAFGRVSTAEVGRRVARLCPVGPFDDVGAGAAFARFAAAPDGDVTDPGSPDAPQRLDDSDLDGLDRTEIEEPSGATTALRHNLPAAGADFIGRHAELDRIEAALGRTPAWLTLVGPGGVGKTRLALRHAELALGTYQTPGAGVWFCDLGEARDAEGLCRILASTLEITVSAERVDAWAAALGVALRKMGRMLLILDNLEQVAEVASVLLASWLESCESLHLIATSRRPLRGAGEVVISVDPLQLGDDPLRSDAFRLFVARAARSRGGYHPAPEDTQAIAEIIEALDGLPLAIELAAARMNLLSPAQILERLASRFTLLGRSAGGETHARHLTLAATLAWSWDLLQPFERSALAQMTLFRGGFALEAAEAVVDLSAHPDAPLTLDVLQSLKDHALLRAHAPAGGLPPRFHLYQSVKAFAREKLETFGLAHATRARHARTYLQLGEALARVADRSEGVRTLRMLRAEFDNLMGAADALGDSDPAARARVLLALDPVLHHRVPVERWLALHAQTLEAATRADDPALKARAHLARAGVLRFAGRLGEAVEEAFVARELARQARDQTMEGEALSLAGFAACEQGDFEIARARLDEAIPLLEPEEDRAPLARAYGRRGIVEAKGEGMAQARAFWERAVALFEQADHPAGRSNNLKNLALITQNHDPERAKAYYLEALAIFVELGDRRSQASTLNNIGTVYADLGQHSDARSAYTRVLHLLEQNEDLPSEAICRANLLILEHLCGRLAVARHHADEALRLSEEIGDTWLAGLTRAHLAALEARQGKVRLATEGFEAARAELDATGTSYFQQAFEVLTGLLDLARAREAAGRGEGILAGTHLAAAKEKYDTACTPADDGKIPAEHDTDLRLAARLLEAALAETR